MNHLQYLEREPILPVQSTFWRFPESLHLTVAGQLGRLEARLRQRVSDAANLKLTEVTLDTDTAVHTLYGSQMGGRVSYNPKNKGKRSYQPIPTFVAGTRDFAGGGLRKGDRPDGEEIAEDLKSVIDRCLRIGRFQTAGSCRTEGLKRSMKVGLPRAEREPDGCVKRRGIK